MVIKSKKRLRELEDIAEKLGVRVIFDNLETEGGYCRCHKDKYIIVNKKLNTEYQINVLAKAMKKLPLEDIYIKPELRKFLDNKKY